MRAYWYVWFVVGFGIPEAYAVLSGQPTLSQTWKELRDTLPLWAAIVLSAATAGALFWLTGVHWIWSSLDRPGFDWLERAIVGLGVLFGGIAAISSRRKRTEEDSPSV